MNPKQSGQSLNFFIALFDSSSLEYIGTSIKKWTGSLNAIKKILCNNGFGSRNIRVGIFEQERIRPSMQPIESIFRQGPKNAWCRMFINIAVESDDECKSILICFDF
jgi:hypothetical protein